MTRKLKSSRAENFIDDIFCVIGFFINLFSKVGKFLASFSKPKALKQEIKARTKFAIFNPKPNHFYEVGLYSDRPRNAKETELGYKPQGRNAKGHFMPKNKNEVVEKSGRIIRFNPK